MFHDISQQGKQGIHSHVMERRKKVRRQGDRDFLARVQQMQGDTAEDEASVRQLRRRAIRHSCTVHIAPRAQMEEEQEEAETAPVDHPIKGRLLDLSNDGCSLFTLEPFELGGGLSLIIGLRSGSKVAAAGTIRWTKVIPQRQGHATGVLFERLDRREAKLIQGFLQELDETIGL
jgi:hypothetical protein